MRELRDFKFLASRRGGSKAEVFQNAFLKSSGTGTTQSAPLRLLRCARASLAYLER